MDNFNNIISRINVVTKGVVRRVFGSAADDRNQAITLATITISGVIGLCLVSFIATTVITDSVQPTNLQDSIVLFTNQFGQSHSLIVEISDTEELQREGLMFRTFLPAEQGMLFVFKEELPRRFWMKNTLVSLDMIFIDSQGRVVTIHENTRPNQTEEVYPSAIPAMYVLETNAGWVQSTELEVGDLFDLNL